MTAFAALSLLDNAGAAVVLSPSLIDSTGVAKWFGAESIQDAKRAATMSVALAKNGSTVNRVKLKVSIPIMSSVNAETKIAEAYATVEFVLPKLASQTVRLDLRKLVDTFVMHAAVTAAVTSLESQY